MAVQFCYAAPILTDFMMNNSKVDLGLKVILALTLLAVPVISAIGVWSLPFETVGDFLTGVVTVNVFLSLAEVVFLIRAVIFPRTNTKWWKDV